MNVLTPELIAAAGFPPELIPYVDRDVLIFSHARPDGTLEFMVPNEDEPKSDFTLVWHPEDKATWDYDGLRFYVKEEKYRDVDHEEPLSRGDLVDFTNFPGDEPEVCDLIDWLDELPEARKPGAEALLPEAIALLERSLLSLHEDDFPTLRHDLREFLAKSGNGRWPILRSFPSKPFTTQNHANLRANARPPCGS